jgi:hypothetical protein
VLNLQKIFELRSAEARIGKKIEQLPRRAAGHLAETV